MATSLLTPVTAMSAAKKKKVKILYVLTNHSELGDTKRTGFYLSELTHPYYVFKEAGYQIDIASPKGGPAPIDPKKY